MITTVVFLFITLATRTISSIDYCSESLCEGEKRIACDNNGKFQAECPSNVVKIEFTDKLKMLAVNSQNAFRDQIARGKIKKYDRAARMATLVWNDELAKLAELNVFRCRFGHDECRNTAVFMYAGQNLGMLQNNKKLPPPEKVFESITRGWFEEHKDAGMNYIDKFSHHKSGKQIGHFTQLCRDQAYAVGCAMVKFKKGIWFTTLYACDYSLSNIKDNAIYEKGKTTASGCKKGTNKDFPGLCHPSEIFDNDLFYNN